MGREREREGDREGDRDGDRERARQENPGIYSVLSRIFFK